MFFGLSLLLPEEVNDCYSNDLMSIKPINAFLDYILKNYIKNTTYFYQQCGLNIRIV